MDLDLLPIKEAKYVPAPTKKRGRGEMWVTIFGTISLVGIIIWFCFEAVRQLWG